MEHTYYQAAQRRTYQEMRQKPAPRDTFFSLRNEQVLRPTSVATEFVDTDWDGDDDDIISEPEDNSPRVSLQSSGQPSFTTLSSYDEVPTPRSSRSREAYLEHSPKAVEGPRGPHLFRSSTAQSFDEDAVLSLSPITPKAPRGIGELLAQPQLPRRNSPFQYTRDELNRATLAQWTPEMVAQSMLNAGIELSLADRFIENDINGPILITLKFEDLRELDIPSFGMRTRVWHQIQALRDNQTESSPRPPTPIEDAPSREARRDARQADDCAPKRHRSTNRKNRRNNSTEDIITPMESVSIIGIEQVIPKPHQCSKGENCSKWRKQQRTIEQFKLANPNVDIKQGGTVMMINDSWNPEAPPAIGHNDSLRPMSDAVPSVVASSDVLGPSGMTPFQYLHEATLRNLQTQDPQDNVRQFLNFQNHETNEVPPTPPYEVAPAAQPPHHGLRRLPKLSIPGAAFQAPQTPQAPRPAPQRASTVPQPTHYVQEPEEFVPYEMEKACPMSPDLETPRNPYRFGTPFSEMDVPLTAVPLGPVARDFSQSVPPEMNYRAHQTTQTPPRAQSRASSRRPSFPVLPALDENKPIRVASRVPSPPAAVRPPPQQHRQPPPRFNYPWSPQERTQFEQAIPPMSTFGPGEAAATTVAPNGVTHQGPMKKRKTRMLRHEWQDGYFTLKGTRLNMHKDAREVDRTLEYVDIDDYAIACSSLASSSKLSAAFKAVSISHNREKSDPIGAFSFQLIPQEKNGNNVGARLRKRESALSSFGGSGNVPAEGVNGTGKTHHFAVKGRDDRIDWMRELMLAKALKQKGEGFEISVNGNMI